MKQKSIKKNVFMNIILNMSNFLFPLITYGYASRILTPIGIGKVTFVSSIIQYFSYIAILGIPAYGLREAAKIRDDKDKLSKLVHELLFINIISTIISLLLLTISVMIIPKLNDYRLLFLVMSASIFLNTIGVEWLYNALEEYTYITIRSLIFKIIYIPLVFLLIKDESDYIIYGFLSIFVTSANYLCNFINIRKYINLKKYDNYEIKKHLKPIFILFSASIIISIYANFDIIMIGIIKDEATVGLYNTALKIKNIILSLSTAVTAVFIPRIANYISKHDLKKVKELILISFQTSMLLAFPFAIYGLINSYNIILFISGKDYIFATSTLQVLMLCLLLLIMTNLFGNQLLIPLGMEKRFTKSVFFGLIINLILNLLLIPKYGSYGAAFGTLITELWNMIYMAIGVKEYAHYILSNSNIIKYLVALIISACINFILSVLLANVNVILYLLITGSSFIFAYYLILLILKEKNIVNILNRLFIWIKKVV